MSLIGTVAIAALVIVSPIALVTAWTFLPVPSWLYPRWMRTVRPRASGSSPFRRRARLLTDNEDHFLSVIAQAVPEYEVYCQVALSALVDIDLPESSVARFAAIKALGAKSADFVLVNAVTTAPVLVIELDDASHDKKKGKDRQRDEMLRRAGLETLRCDSRRKPSAEQLRHLLTPLLNGKQYGAEMEAQAPPREATA